LTWLPLWTLRGALSTFKLPSRLFFLTQWEQIERFRVQISCFSLYPFLLMMWIWSHLTQMDVQPLNLRMK
jgi:hypothetical protein